MIKAVIFDFNGTLFYDTLYHNQAWRYFAAEHGKKLSADDLEYHIHGLTNKEILHFIVEKELSEGELLAYSIRKEKIYRSLCLTNVKACKLAPGATHFFKRLQKYSVPFTIATASIYQNVKFFFTLFELEKWFEINKVVFDDGQHRGKPHPDMFLAAAKKLNTPIEQCLIIEDSIGGVKAANNSGAGQIVAMSHDDNPGKFSQFDFIDQIITDFKQVEFDFVR